MALPVSQEPKIRCCLNDCKGPDLSSVVPYRGYVLNVAGLFEIVPFKVDCHFFLMCDG